MTATGGSRDQLHFRMGTCFLWSLAAGATSSRVSYTSTKIELRCCLRRDQLPHMWQKPVIGGTAHEKGLRCVACGTRLTDGHQLPSTAGKSCIALNDGHHVAKNPVAQPLGRDPLWGNDTQCRHVPSLTPEHASPATTGSNQESPLRRVSREGSAIPASPDNRIQRESRQGYLPAQPSSPSRKTLSST